MTVLVEIARPKINLSLRVLGKRSDGYHALMSLVAFADGPGDRITLDCGAAVRVSTSGPFAGGIAGPNLICTVLDLVAAAADAGNIAGLRLGHVHLEKNLPVAAGIGGGSADAGALLRLIQRANANLAGAIDWRGIAQKLGADVPVCLFDRAAFMSGIGDRLDFVADLPRLDVVLVNPMVAVPADKTAQVFRALGAAPLAEENDDAVSLLPLANRAQLLALIEDGNDLQRAARRVVPAIGDVHLALSDLAGAQVVAMSGAGPTSLAVFEDAERAQAAAAVLRAEQPRWWSAAARVG